MPRTSRKIAAGQCYHVINRGNNSARVFHESSDYTAFLSLMTVGQERCALALFAYCLMPNHIHLVVRPADNRALTLWCHWVFTTHAMRHHKKYRTSGRIWQGRFKAFVIQQDHHLLAVLRYVERNPLRAGMVSHAEQWPWSSLSSRREGAINRCIAPSPVPLPGNWIEHVNRPQTPPELAALRACVNRQQPFGDRQWVRNQ